MKKIVINTQYMENYGDSLNPYMKFKGGSTYVVNTLNDGITENEVATIVAQVRPLIQMTMADTNGGCEEYIIDFQVYDTIGEACIPEWETITELWFDDKPGGGSWKALKVTDNRDNGWMRKEILEKTEAWTCGLAQERSDYSVSFLLEDGDIVDSNNELKEWLDAKEAA
jgi:hypothetical protein